MNSRRLTERSPRPTALSSSSVTLGPHPPAHGVVARVFYPRDVSCRNKPAPALEPTVLLKWASWRSRRPAPMGVGSATALPPGGSSGAPDATGTRSSPSKRCSAAQGAEQLQNDEGPADAGPSTESTIHRNDASVVAGLSKARHGSGRRDFVHREIPLVHVAKVHSAT